MLPFPKRPKLFVGGDAAHRPTLYAGDDAAWRAQAFESSWLSFPGAGMHGGVEWVARMLQKEPPCLSLRAQASPNRASRVKSRELQDGFQRYGHQLLPARKTLDDLFDNLLEAVRFPPSFLELSWRAHEIEKRSARDHQAHLPDELRRLSDKPCQFMLLNNLADAPARQPPHFRRYHLRPEQLRSLAWMLMREGYEGDLDGKEALYRHEAVGEQEPFVAEWRQLWTCERSCACVDVRARASYPVRGGILADRVGFGKTATTIGLIDMTQHCPSPPVPPPDAGSFIPAKGTLVIVPSNLLDQWAQEISKFVWDGSRLVALNSGWKAGRSKEGCPLKVITIGTVSPLRLITASELAEADIVLCSYRLLFSQIYQDRREDLAAGRSLVQLMQATNRLLQGSLTVGDKNQVHDVKTLKFPMLEMFYWHRVVFDEFHELESFQSAQQSVLQHMRAHSRWGLTGTPPIDNIAGVIFMSSLFRCELPGYLPVEQVPVKKGSRQMMEVPHVLFYEDDRLMQETATRFLDRFVRQNTAELPHIALQNRVFIVRHTPAEQALYLGEAHDSPDMNRDDSGFLGEDGVKALERLLKLCSHFQGGNPGVGISAQMECQRLGVQRSQRRGMEKRRLARCCRVVQFLLEKVSRAPPDDSCASFENWRAPLDEAEASLKAQGRPAVEELAEEENAVVHEDINARCRFLAGHRPRAEDLAEVLASCVAGEAGVGSLRHWEAFASLLLTQREAQKLLNGQVREQVDNLKTFCGAVASQDYFECVKKALVESWPNQRMCLDCCKDDIALTRLAITPCGHSFCVDCLAKAAEATGVCSCCRQAIQPRDAQSLVSEGLAYNQQCQREGVEVVVVPPADHTEDSMLVKHGTKLMALVQKLQELRQQDTTAKAILFVQFDDLKLQVAAALREGSIPTAQLKGSVSQRASIIRDWQENPDSRTFVLLLSLAESASGTNLTAASHIVFLHPMLASTEERAVAQELQAIGRARRHGQQRETLHVWRFVTDGTVEIDITQRRQTMMMKHEDECKARSVPMQRAKSK
eukprot:TRINITY_DN31898_c0_g1_i1.p1 TRINITY_DN31898_c0_g1~~TRINITY_DN31898_c0_g1_i1.p1  ORF type:complete len:1039 (-),score=190.22 TRINITY_DN31898_c0_g1_i1:177-3293(-)